MDREEEKSILNRFQVNYSNFPTGTIDPTDKPDFIVYGNQKVGIEITQVFQDQDENGGSFIRTMENYKRVLLSDIVKRLKTESFPKCLVSVSFNLPSLSNTVKPKIIADKCVDDILSNFRNKEIIEHFYYTVENENHLPKLVECYSLWFDSNLEEIDYVETAGSVGKPLTNIEIQYILDKKERAKADFQFCDTYWLIIKEGSFSADYFPSITVDRSILKSTFDKIFVIRQFQSEIIELK